MRIILILLCVLLVSCQKKKPIQKVIHSPNQIKIERLYNDLNSITKESLDSILLYVNRMEHLAKNEPKEYQAMAVFMKGVYYSNDTSFLLSNKNFDVALQLLKNSDADTLKAKIYNGIGNNYKIKGDYPKAFDNLYKALKIYERYQDKNGICSVNTILGEINFQKGNIPLSKENIKTALKVLENDKLNQYYLSAAHSLANIYGISGDFKNAIAIDEEGIRLSDSIHSSKMKVAFLDNKANCYLYSNRLDSAQYYFEKCLQIDLENGNRKQIADSYTNLGQLYFAKRDYAKAEQLTIKSIAILDSIDGKVNLDKAYHLLVSIYSQQQKFEKAFKTQNLLIQNYMSMIDEKEAASFAEYKTVYETQKKQSEIQSLKQERKISKLKIKAQASEIAKRNYLIVGFLLVVLGFLFIFYMWNSKQKLRNQLFKEKIVRDTEEQERLRIAKDIHDDLGSGLSKINFLSELIFQKADSPEVKSNSESVRETAAKMIENMRDLIWALNPDNTTLVNLVSRMREYTTDYLEDYPITIRYEIPEFLPQTAITKESHRELFMVVKETLNNIAKYAQATDVVFAVTLTESDFMLCIQDNGIGFDTAATSKGNGLRNMKNRLEALGGIISISSEDRKGTVITVRISLEKITKSHFKDAM